MTLLLFVLYDDDDFALLLLAYLFSHLLCVLY